MTVFGDLVGQRDAVHQLQQAAADAAGLMDGGSGKSMTHAWLFTGPPGSGRSVAARAFAAALQCANGGCGECSECHEVAVGSHPDVTIVSADGVHYAIEDIRRIVAESSGAPIRGKWRVIVIEDADRLEGASQDWRAANVLLKAVEEPGSRTVWVLCAPSVQDVLPTIRSRCRVVALRTPSAEEVAGVLVDRFGADPAIAAFAARASQGHIGRARRLVTDEDTRIRRAEVLSLPNKLTDLQACLQAAEWFVDAAADETKGVTTGRDADERNDLKRSLGVGTAGTSQPKGADRMLKDLGKRQERRARRMRTDLVDVALVDLLSFYRDVLVVQWGARVPLVNEEYRGEVERAAAGSSSEATLMRMDEIVRTREVLGGNAQPRLVLESMFLALRDPSVVGPLAG